MTKTLNSLLACVLGISGAKAAVLASWDSFENLNSTTGDLVLSLDKHGTAGVTHANGEVTLATNGRTWVDISSLDMNLSNSSYSISMDVSNLTLSNGPIFSMTSGNYNTQTTAFGSSSSSGKWAFSNNGSNMQVLGNGVNISDTFSGTLTVNFTMENGKNYVSAFLGNDVLVQKTEISYSATNSASNNLTGLTLGGWGSTSNFGAAFTINSLTIASIPEPATASLGLLGIFSLLMRRRRA